MTNRIGEERHGTITGYARHQRRGEKPCERCAAAKSKYDKKRRLEPMKLKMSRLQAKAQSQATSKLRRNHAEEYQILYQEAKQQLISEME
jgi:hypothetical protein